MRGDILTLLTGEDIGGRGSNQDTQEKHRIHMGYITTMTVDKTKGAHFNAAREDINAIICY